MRNSIVGEKFFRFIALCGVIPFSKRKVYRLERNLLFYCRFVLLIVLVAQGLTFNLHRHFLEQPFFLYTLVFFNSFGYGVCCVLSLLCIHFRASDICRILNKIIESSKKLPPISEDAVLKPFVFLSFVVFEMWLVIYALFYAVKGYGEIFNLRTIIGLISLVTNHNVLCCNYTFLVIALNGYLLLKKLNERFGEIIGRCFPSLLGNFGLADRRVMVLRDFYSNYCHILDIMSDLNDCFSEINLMSFMFSSSAVIFSVYFFIMKITPRNSLIVFNVADVVYFVFFFIGKSLMHLLVSRKIAQEFDYVVDLLRGLYAGNNDPKIQDEIEIISLQMYHRNIVFSACGFFNLDNSVILAMIDGVTTYLIILLQLEDNPSRGMTKCVTNGSYLP